ncbi:MAG: hypothetical protein M1818_006395 [Claussenomyces sp. TS43310]|nr:MAG: hypothetical protein M1818_006395 [Claussenomyces sp. TS43310]
MNFVVPGQPTGEDWHKVGAQLRRIDTALQNRSTTVEADEPLCMATLLDLNIDFRSVPETLNARMCHIWTSVAAKYGGLPQQMIFLEHSKLKVRGFQWAPESLLHASGNDRFGPHARLSFWSDSELGQINRRGFLVEYPGFKLERSHPMGRNPGETLRVPLEFQVAFTANNGILYQIGRIETNASEIVKDGRQFIHDLICQGSCALVAKEPWTKGSPKELVVQALIVDIMEADSCILYSRIRCHVILIEALPSMRLAVMHAERLGQVLREAPTSKRAIELMSNEQSAEYIVAVAALQAKAKEIAGDALENVPGLSDAVSDSFGGDEALGGYWTFVTLAYRYGSFKGTALPRSQKWCLE